MEKPKLTSTQYKNKFISDNYERINLTVPKGRKDVIKAHADIHDGGSVNKFIQRAIDEQIARDNENQ